ncbi:hypothetical protein M3Y98_00033100 [Aphelenchoides besseyi]|nr:hypothetical protein M3Y98_00033100 [Aphelenchoides besseyi]
MAKKADDQKSAIAYVFNILDGKKVFVHGSMEQAPSVQHASSECNVEMPTDPLEQAKFERLRRFIGYPPWIVRMLLYFLEEPLDVGYKIDEANHEIQTLLDKHPAGFAHEFYEAQLKAVKFVGSIADDVLAVQRGTKKFEYPWAFRDG